MTRRLLAAVFALAISLAAHCGGAGDMERRSDDTSSSSSIRWKENVVTLKDSLDRVTKLRGVEYNWKPQYRKEGQGTRKEIGFIAEEVAPVVPEIVEWEVEGKEPSGVKYERATALLTEAAKELKGIADVQKARLDKVEQRVTDLEAEVDGLKSRLDTAEQTIGDHTTSLTTHDLALRKLQKTLTELDEEVASMDGELQSLKSCCGNKAAAAK